MGEGVWRGGILEPMELFHKIKIIIIKICKKKIQRNIFEKKNLFLYSHLVSVTKKEMSIHAPSHT